MRTKTLIVVLVILTLAGGVAYLAWPVHGFGEINYVGMTREQVLAACEGYDRFLDNQIMIQAGPVFRYHATVAEARRDPVLQEAAAWGINFRRGLIRTYYYEVHFENDVVVRQDRSWYGDL